jgi:Citrate synthase
VKNFIEAKGLEEGCAKALEGAPREIQEMVVSGNWGPSIRSLNKAISSFIRNMAHKSRWEGERPSRSELQAQLDKFLKEHGLEQDVVDMLPGCPA